MTSSMGRWVAWLFGEQYESGPPWGVTRRCLPGRMSRRGDPHPKVLPAGVGGVRGTWTSCQARAAASVRSAVPAFAQDVGHVL
jgi:hypothetical protein